MREVVFPVVGEQTLRDLVDEGKATGPPYRTTSHAVIRNSYSAHYRRMVPIVLDALDFRSNNQAHRPVIEALALVRRYADTKLHSYPADEDVPIDGVVPAALARRRGRARRPGPAARQPDHLRDLRAGGAARAAALQGDLGRRRRPLPQPGRGPAGRLRGPAGRTLCRPRPAPRRRRFIAELQAEMTAALATLDRGLPRNPYVRILKRGGGLDHADAAGAAGRDPRASSRSRPKSPALADDQPARHGQGGRPAARLHRRPQQPHRLRDPRSRASLRPRLLLCLHGLGTNAGLKRMAAGQTDVTYKDLLYVRRRFITRTSLREAIAQVVERHAARPRPRASGARARRPAPPTPSTSAPGTRT